MGKYRDEDVDSLVWAATSLNKLLVDTPGTVHLSVPWSLVNDALTPFLPDPDEGLVEKMADVLGNLLREYPTYPTSIEGRAYLINVSKDILTVVKDTGHYK